MWSTPATFDRLRAALAADGWASHAPCLPLHDRDVRLPPPAGLGRLRLRDYADFLVAEAGKLGPRPIILGHSMGSLLAQMVAARVPHAGLVLLSPAPAAGTGSADLSQLRMLWPVVRHWGWWEQATLLPADAARWGVFNGVPDEVADAETARLVWDSGRALAEMAAPGLTGHASRVDYARLQGPNLVVVGLEDRTTPPAIARNTARRLPGRLDYHEWDDVGHWLFWGATEQRLLALLTSWLSGLA